MTPQKLQNTTVIVVYLLVSVLVTWIGLSRGMIQLMAAWALFPVGVYFVNRPDVLLCITVALYGSQLQMPGLPGGLTLYYISAFLFVVIAFLGKIINRTLFSDLGMSSILVIAFLTNTLVVIGARGVGFSALGDENIGGMRYVSLIIPCTLFLVVRYVALTPTQWHRAFLWMLALSCLPFIGELLFVLSGGVLYQLYYVIAFSELTLGTIYDFVGGEDLLRFYTSSSAALAVEVFALYAVGFLHFRKYITGGLLLFALVLGSLSGHRIILIRIIMYVWFFGLFYMRGKKLRYCFMSAILLVFFLLCFYVAAPYLPLNAQRMVSFLPGIDISMEAKMSAHSTTTWRLDVWMEAIKLIPDYFWLGKGYTFSQGITEALMLGARGDYVYFWALETVAYHNGLLSLLIGLGISGLIIGGLLLIKICYRHYTFQQQKWRNPVLKKIHNLLLINAIVNVLTFFTIYGDVHVSFPGIFFYFLAMENIAYSNTKCEK